MEKNNQRNEVHASDGDAISTRDISASDGGQVNINSPTHEHRVPKPHNQKDNQQFNGAASLFQFLAKYVSTRVLDSIFGAFTVSGGLVSIWAFVVDIYPVWGTDAFHLPMYLLPAFCVFIVGAGYLGLRADSVCPQCGEAFSLRRTQKELGRDKIEGDADDLLIREETECVKCSYEDEREFWEDDPKYSSNDY